MVQMLNFSLKMAKVEALFKKINSFEYIEFTNFVIFINIIINIASAISGRKISANPSDNNLKPVKFVLLW